MIVAAGQRLTRIDELLPPALAAQLDRLDVTSRKVFAGKLQGERRSKQRGSSVEFADHRLYAPGDDLRRIDWSVLARLDRLFVRVFEEDQDLTVHIVLDASPSMLAGTRSPIPAAPGQSDPVITKLACAQRLAMALAYIGLVNNNRVLVSVLDGVSLRRLAGVRGRRHVPRVAGFLLDAAGPHQGRSPERPDILSDEEYFRQIAAAPQAPGQNAASADPKSPAGAAPARIPGDWTSALRATASARGGRGVCVLVSDFLIPGGYAAGLSYLAARGFDTLCVQVLTPEEIDPTRNATPPGDDPDLVGDLELVDIETGAAAEVTITPELLAEFRDASAAYVRELHDHCAARGMTHVLIPANADLARVIVDQLRRARALR